MARRREPADPRRPRERLQERLTELAGEPIDAGAAVLLDTPERVWWVETGRVELFAMERVEQGGELRDGPRRHLGTARPGALLFGVRTTTRLHLLAVPLQGARLRPLDAAALRPLARDAEINGALVARIEDWLELLFSEVVAGPAPQGHQDLRPGQELHLEEAGQVARGAQGVVWLRHVTGGTHFLGRRELPLRPAGYLLPVVERTWVVSTGETRISCVETAILLRGGGVWEGLERCHDLFLRYLALRIQEAVTEERQRVERKVELDRGAMRGAYGRLASVLGRGGTAALAEVGDPADALFAAVEQVAMAQGITVRPPPPRTRSTVGGSTGMDSGGVDRICDASRVRYRRVILRDDWWRRDNGPLLAYRPPAEEGGDRRPVALLPTSHRSYDLLDPVLGRRTPLDEAAAGALEGDAFMFYPPLPDRPLKGMDLLRLALRDRRRDLSSLVLMGAAGGLLGLLIPILTGQIFGEVIPDADRSLLGQMTAALVVGALAAAAFQITRSIALLRLGGKIDGSLQAAVWDRLLSLPVSFFRRYTVGDLAVRSMGIDTIREILTGNVTTSLLAAVFSVFSFALLFYYSRPLALVATGLVVLLMVVTATLSYFQLRHQRRLLALQGKLESLLFGLITGISKLRIAGAEPRAYALWAERFAEQRERSVQARKVANVQLVINAVYMVLTSMALFAMVTLSLREALSVSAFLAFNAAFGQFLGAALSIVNVFSTVLVLIPVYERLSPILETAPEVDTGKAEAGELAGDIELNHVSFRYTPDGPLILNDVSIRARPGEFIALVGPSGSGKSTTLRLILGFDQPEAGSIYFDGQDLPNLDIGSVRRQIGVVLQNGRPMVGDIFSNIVGATNLRMDAAWEAARMAGLEDDIKAMPMGMHTIISEGASTFSGGQQQRLMIARAVVAKPRILLFDEATSALDNRTQEIVSRSLESLKATRIVVAHRLSTIRNADRIYVIEAGRVVEEGNFEELTAAGGTFSRLVERQMA